MPHNPLFLFSLLQALRRKEEKTRKGAPHPCPFRALRARPDKMGGPTPRCSSAPRASVTYPARCMQHTWLGIRARSGMIRLAVSTPCVKVIHGPSLRRPHHYWLYTARGEIGNRPRIKTNEATMETSRGQPLRRCCLCTY